jgi:potassium channel subfamily K, other eukaryote
MSARMQQKLLKKVQKQNSQIQDSLTKRQRLKQEFELIRQAQDIAVKKRRWIALLISGSVWFILWLVSAAVFRATENAQSWTYFESVYFAYICLLTIGYGDFYPQSSFGKAFFVFWSLLAVPSLTILISNMGDTVAKEIKDVTLFLGNLTILPGEEGVKTTVKRAAIKFTKRKIFGRRTREAPSNVLGRKNHSVCMSQNLHAGSASDAPLGLISQEERVGEKGKPKVLPKSSKDLHCLLIKEIVTVTKHVNNSPHRKYTFEEWEWYLKLLKQDGFETYAHGITLGRQKFDGENRKAVACECGDGIGQEANGGRKSSWVGNRSPLVCNKDEPQWILERLTKMLERELESVRREELEQNDDTGRI